MTGLPANSLVKGGLGESAGGCSAYILKVVIGASGIQKMKPTESET